MWWPSASTLFEEEYLVHQGIYQDSLPHQLSGSLCLLGCRRARVIYAHCHVWLPLESGYLVRMRITFHAPLQRQVYFSDPEPLETETVNLHHQLCLLCRLTLWTGSGNLLSLLSAETLLSSPQKQRKDDGCLSSLPPLLPLGSVGDRVPVAPPTPASGGLGLQVCATILRLLLNLILDMVLLHVWSKFKTELSYRSDA